MEYQEILMAIFTLCGIVLATALTVLVVKLIKTVNSINLIIEDVQGKIDTANELIDSFMQLSVVKKVARVYNSISTKRRDRYEKE